VVVPTNYFYSFQAQKNLIKFEPHSLVPMAHQLAHVQVLCRTLFDAHVPELESIQRARVSEDDVEGGFSAPNAFGMPSASVTADYISNTIITNDVATIAPYKVHFRGFSTELAAVVNGLMASPHGFIIKTIDITQAAGGDQYLPGGEGQPTPDTTPMTPGATEGAMAPAATEGQPPADTAPREIKLPRRGRGLPQRGAPPVAPAPPPRTSGGGAPPSAGPGAPAKTDAGGLTTVINERPFRVSMLVYVVSVRGGGK
jgi:hypothetical protein